MTSVSDAEFVFRGVDRPDAYGPASDAVAVREGIVIALGAEHCAANGTLHVGMAADLAVLDSDPLEVTPGDLSTIRVRATYIAGRPVHVA